ncbi:spermidine synthase [Leucobacter sp. OH1287]|uniref:spermidine synthase n=1 Tax=Leucobacter sp. OH1287 TaxID=2491049 RepID=UPI000F602C36|nr:spermine synthase [Leucobacter sp. OH1287]
MTVLHETTLPDGSVAAFEADPYNLGAVQLLLNGTPQSHINPADPSQLFFSYMRRIGHLIDACAPAEEPICAIHLGGGAFTLPRYIAATRPGSGQQVIELNGELVDFVRAHYPLPQRANIRIRRGDAREVAAKLPAGLHGKADIIVVDVFAGARTPAHVTSREFYETLLPFLAPTGLIVVNAADGQGQRFVRSQLATLQSMLPRVAAVAEPQVLKGRRFGNVVLVGALADRDFSMLPRALNAGPHPARLLLDAELAAFIAGAKPVTDQTATASPQPPEGLFG